MEIILASASPRRRELLHQVGAEFTVIPARGDEVITAKEPKEAVVELAANKAGEIYAAEVAGKRNQPDTLVIGADTIVVCDGRILGKPKDEKDAEDMLSMLSGRSHEVYTGVSLWIWEKGITTQQNFYERTEVKMYPIRETEIKSYIKSGEPMDKAGSYGIQGLGAKFIEKIDGDYNNVVGLPLARIYQELMQLGIDISHDS